MTKPERKAPYAVPGKGDEVFSGRSSVFWFFLVLSFLFLLPVNIILLDPNELKDHMILPLVILLTDLVCIFLVIGLYNPVKFRWALKIVTMTIFLGTSYYLGAMVHDFIVNDTLLSGGLGSASLENAIVIWGIIGLPSGFYTVRKRNNKSQR